MELNNKWGHDRSYSCCKKWTGSHVWLCRHGGYPAGIDRGRWNPAYQVCLFTASNWTSVCRGTCPCSHAHLSLWRLQTISVSGSPHLFILQAFCEFLAEVKKKKWRCRVPHIKQQKVHPTLWTVGEVNDKTHHHFPSFRSHVHICLLPLSGLLCASVSPSCGKIQTAESCCEDEMCFSILFTYSIDCMYLDGESEMLNLSKICHTWNIINYMYIQ